MAKDVATLGRLITDFRQIRSKDSVSPESLGFLLQSILDTIDEIALRRVESAAAAVSELETKFASLVQRFDTLLGNNASEAIDNFNEVLAFLSGLKDNERLASTLNYLHSRVAQNSEGITRIDKERADERKEASSVLMVSSAEFEAGEDAVTMFMGMVNLLGEARFADTHAELPVACGPVAGQGAVRPQPGQAGIITGDDYGRFDGAAEFASGLADKTALGDIGFTASEGQVSFTRPKYRLDGGNPWIDGDGNPVAVPANGLWSFPMASGTQAGAITAAQARAITDAPELAFRGLWRSAGCSVDEAAEPSEMYLCNGLGMSYAEARAVYAAGVMTNDNRTNLYAACDIRTHLPHRIHTGTATCNYTFRSSKVEVVSASLLVPGTDCFRWCSKLRKVTLYAPNMNNTANSTIFEGCSALESIVVYGTVYARSFSLADSPLINLASLQGIINKAQAGSAAMTITVHPVVYAKMTDTDSVTADLRWLELPVLAAEKNITFTTK